MYEQINSIIADENDFQFSGYIGTILDIKSSSVWRLRLKGCKYENIVGYIISTMTKSKPIQLYIILSRYSIHFPCLNSKVPDKDLPHIDSGRVKVYIIRIDNVEIPQSLSRFECVDFIGPFPYIKSIGDFSQLMKKRPSRMDGIIDRSRHTLQEITRIFNNEKLTLVLGAGMSIDAGIPDWNTLLRLIGEEAIAKFKEENPEAQINSKEHYWFTENSTMNPAVRSRGYKNILHDQLPEALKKSIYLEAKSTSRFYDSLTKMISEFPDYLDAIVTFNFDSLIEDKIGALGQPIYSDASKRGNGVLPIYHVHGYIPKSEDIPKDQNLVFTEDEYHMKYENPDDWSNKVQVDKFSRSHCLFLGLSLTDPNLRRLLDSAATKNNQENYRHYMVKEIPVEKGQINQFEMLLFEKDCEQFRIKVIWVESYQQIPGMIDYFRIC